MKAFKLINTVNGACDFLKGSIPEMKHILSDHFFIQSHIEAYQLVPHPAPRFQYVITLRGRLKFTVSNGGSFFIEPGIILIAGDLEGQGHTWEIMDGDQWERIYIVPPQDAIDPFIPE